jgi:hypothetical protein
MKYYTWHLYRFHPDDIAIAQKDHGLPPKKNVLYVHSFGGI